MESESCLRIPARLEHLGEVRRFVWEASLALNVEPDIVSDMLLAVDEATTNIIVHGYRGCRGTIEVVVEHASGALVVRLRDEADPFDPCCVPPPDLDLPLEQREPGGLGVHLMRQVVDEVSHRPMGERGNELTLVKKERHAG
jgi:serine/threonine-protein kinase RsbW